MEAPGFCRVADVSGVEQQGQGLGFVYPANAVIQSFLSWNRHCSSEILYLFNSKVTSVRKCIIKKKKTCTGL